MGRSRSNTTAASRSSEPRAVRYVSRQRRRFHRARNGAEAADYSGFERRRQESARQGKLRGIGITTYIEASALRPLALLSKRGKVRLQFLLNLFEVFRICSQSLKDLRDCGFKSIQILSYCVKRRG